MKKIISTLLISTFLLPANLVFAENDTKEMEQLLHLVKERIGNTNHYTEFNSYLNSYDSETIYTFSWNATTDNNSSSLTVSCNQDGIITEYYSYNQSDDIYNPKLSISGTKKAEAMEKAEKEIKKLNPEIADNLVLISEYPYEDFTNTDYTFTIQRYENNIPVASDTGWISLNSDCSLRNFNLSYTSNIPFDPTENIISNSDAILLYNQKIGLDLSYIILYEDSSELTTKLFYYPTEDNKYIHAVTGDAVEIKNKYEVYESPSYGTSGDNTESDSEQFEQNKLTDAELQNISQISGVFSIDEIDKMIRENKYINIPEKSLIGSSSFSYNNVLGTHTYFLTYYTDNKITANLVVDAQTGEIFNFHDLSKTSSDFEADTNKINALADEIIHEFTPDKADEYKLDEPNDNKTVKYIRYVNDIPVNGSSIVVSFDNEYNLTRYYHSYYNVDFISPENIISHEEATNIICDENNYTPSYIRDYEHNKFVPVYSLNYPNFIDAHSGEFLYNYTDDYKVIEYTDIAGHYAEHQIKTLAEYGLCLDGPELNPDKPITQKDFVALLSAVFFSRDISPLKMNSNIEYLYNTLPDNFFLENEINPTANLTRSEAAKLMVRAMGAEEIAELSGIYASLYNDVTENIGYINILTGFGVLSGDGSGNFHPHNEITNAQALIMIYNYLSR